jgi:hypothetical protein
MLQTIKQWRCKAGPYNRTRLIHCLICTTKKGSSHHEGSPPPSLQQVSFNSEVDGYVIIPECQNIHYVYNAVGKWPLERPLTRDRLLARKGNNHYVTFYDVIPQRSCFRAFVNKSSRHDVMSCNTPLRRIGGAEEKLDVLTIWVQPLLMFVSTSRSCGCVETAPFKSLLR